MFPFESWDDVQSVADELHARFRIIPILAVGCGLRPEELFGLHRADVDRENRLLRVERRYTGGMLKEGGKTAGSVRSIPLRQLVLDAIDAMPPQDRHTDPRSRGAWGSSTSSGSVTASGRRRFARRARAPPDLRLPSHVRDVGDRRRRAALAARDDHGYVRRTDRGHVCPVVEADECGAARAFDAYDAVASG